MAEVTRIKPKSQDTFRKKTSIEEKQMKMIQIGVRIMKFLEVIELLKVHGPGVGPFGVNYCHYILVFDMIFDFFAPSSSIANSYKTIHTVIVSKSD